MQETDQIISTKPEKSDLKETQNNYIKVQNEMFFFIAEFESAAKVRKIAVYRLISLLVPELQRFKDE